MKINKTIQHREKGVEKVQEKSQVEQKIWDLIVIGGGIAGTAIAQRTAMNNDSVLLLLGDKVTKRKSRSMWVKAMHNIPGLHGVGTQRIIKDTLSTLEGFPDVCTILGRKAEKASALTGADEANWGARFTVVDEEGEEHIGASIAICTGMMDKQPIIGEDIKPILRHANQQQVNYCLRCDGHLTKGKTVATFGHTDGAAWPAIVLHERYNNPQHILLNGNEGNFGEETTELMEKYGFTIHPEKVVGILGKARHHQDLEGIELKGGKVVNAQISFVSLGGIVYNETAKQLGCELSESGYVITDESSETSVKHVFAVGDITNGPMKVYTAWEYGVRAADKINGRKRFAVRNQ